MGSKKYWLKLEKGFFGDSHIKIIKNMPNGKDYMIFYLAIMLECLDTEGHLKFNDVVPYNEEMLATITDTNIDIVRSAVKIFKGLGLIQFLEDGTIFLPDVPPRVGKESESAERVRRYRENKRIPQNNRYIVTKCNANKELELKDYTELVNNSFKNYNNSASACVRVRERNEEERESYKSFFKEFFLKIPSDWEEDANEIIDTIIEARDQACTSEGLKFNKKTYYGNDFASLISSLDSENLGQVFKSIHFKEKGEIQNRPVYILSALIQQAEQKKRGGK